MPGAVGHYPGEVPGFNLTGAQYKPSRDERLHRMAFGTAVAGGILFRH